MNRKAPHIRQASRRRRATRSAHERGFTLIELTVSLTAGLVVALGVFALSKSASTTFTDNARSAGAELSLRTAIDRLRADLQRAGFMSTGNWLVDPHVARNLAGGGPTPPVGVRGLASVRLRVGQSTAATQVGVTNFSTVNQVNPDQLDLSGNFTTTDQFVVRAIEPGASCTRLWLSADSPAMWRVRAVGPTLQAEALRNLFQPAALTLAGGGANPDANRQFIARVSDDTGHTQYLATCPGLSAASFNGSDPYVDLQGTLLSGADTSGLGGASGLGTGRLTVNPVQWVRWEIGKLEALAQLNNQSATDYAALQESAYVDGGPADSSKFNLVRTYLDASLDRVGIPELIAEYAVDLKFGFTVDTAANDTGATPTLVTYAIDDEANNANWAYDALTGPFAFRGPQRIRSVRVRLATRAAFADRDARVIPPANYLYRYCTQAGALALSGCTQFARVRTLTTELWLPNQTRSFY